MARIQVVISEAERERFRHRASAEGMSLSEWLRDAGRRQLAAGEPKRLASEQDLRDFFAEIDARREAAGDTAAEEDWDVVKARMAADLDAELDPLRLDS